MYSDPFTAVRQSGCKLYSRSIATRPPSATHPSHQDRLPSHPVVLIPSSHINTLLCLPDRRSWSFNILNSALLRLSLCSWGSLTGSSCPTPGASPPGSGCGSARPRDSNAFRSARNRRSRTPVLSRMKVSTSSSQAAEAMMCKPRRTSRSFMSLSSLSLGTGALPLPLPLPVATDELVSRAFSASGWQGCRTLCSGGGLQADTRLLAGFVRSMPVVFVPFVISSSSLSRYEGALTVYLRLYRGLGEIPTLGILTEDSRGGICSCCARYRAVLGRFGGEGGSASSWFRGGHSPTLFLTTICAGMPFPGFEDSGRWEYELLDLWPFGFVVSGAGVHRPV